ncbi:hypothetical protein [Paenibacillus tyrfis]|uniref:Uncharacterized protein n=1 Tax=Paenibacillus tyrfis TaxID=1501230 RepID=A0A081P282_9BACL|nr:hypothetical protein [Paenibacillus tyrfis]KEQ24805.1 hypothetical protein ET33_06950 [Paenibacillus tyrfis]
MQATMLFFSVTPPAWFASAVTAVAAAGAWMLINTDKGAGTYIDFYGWNHWYNSPSSYFPLLLTLGGDFEFVE